MKRPAPTASFRLVPDGVAVSYEPGVEVGFASPVRVVERLALDDGRIEVTLRCALRGPERFVVAGDDDASLGVVDVLLTERLLTTKGVVRRVRGSAGGFRSWLDRDRVQAVGVAGFVLALLLLLVAAVPSGEDPPQVPVPVSTSLDG